MVVVAFVEGKEEEKEKEEEEEEEEKEEEKEEEEEEEEDPCCLTTLPPGYTMMFQMSLHQMPGRAGTMLGLSASRKIAKEISILFSFPEKQATTIKPHICSKAMIDKEKPLLFIMTTDKHRKNMEFF